MTSIHKFVNLAMSIVSIAVEANCLVTFLFKIDLGSTLLICSFIRLFPVFSHQNGILILQVLGTLISFLSIISPSLVTSDINFLTLFCYHSNDSCCVKIKESRYTGKCKCCNYLHNYHFSNVPLCSSNIYTKTRSFYAVKWCSFRQPLSFTKLLAECGLWSCKDRPTPFHGRMLYRATTPGLVFV